MLTLCLLLDAFARENAFQLLACLALGALSATQLIVFLVSTKFDQVGAWRLQSL